VKDVETNLPRAMIASLAIVFAFYGAISLALVGGDNIDGIAKAEAPLVEAVKAKGWPGMPVAIASLFVIVNGSLAQIVSAARLMMDLARDGKSSMPGVMDRVGGKTHTPWLATLVCGAVVLVLALFFPLKNLASGTSLAILLVFVVANAALWKLKRKSQPEGVPNVRHIVPIAGTILCLIAIVGQVVLWVTGFGAGGSGH
jgi:basic amino acid/polyamine antiporter, APA family